MRSFVNTLDVEEGRETLTTPEALRTWLGEHGLLSPRPGAERTPDVHAALALREALRSLMLANNGYPLDASATETLDRIAQHAPLLLRFQSPTSWQIEPVGDGIDAALGRILVIVYSAMADGTWSRLKACRDQDCAWAFYDGSKNRSATWCTMEVCGNRTKARNYRRRRQTHTPDCLTADGSPPGETLPHEHH